MAFENWRDGLVWATHLKQMLALQEYPNDLLVLPELKPVCNQDGVLVARGIQPKVRPVEAHSSSWIRCPCHIHS
jgi:hypothetical protein